MLCTNHINDYMWLEQISRGPRNNSAGKLQNFRIEAERQRHEVQEIDFYLGTKRATISQITKWKTG